MLTPSGQLQRHLANAPRTNAVSLRPNRDDDATYFYVQFADTRAALNDLGEQQRLCESTVAEKQLRRHCATLFAHLSS